MNNKVYKDAKSAIFDLKSGQSIMSGGFGLCGIAENLIDAISEMDVKDLCVISNNIGNSGRGLVKILRQKKIKRAICTYIGGNPDLEQLMLAKEIDVELVPQGTFSERIRAGGLGIRGFFTPTGFGTIVAQGKEVREFDGKPCIFEKPLTADFAIIKAERGDTYGNLWFKETARNFSPLMAMSAKTTIVEVEELLPLGGIKAEDVHLPGIFVQRIFKGKNYKNDIEILKIDEEKISYIEEKPAKGWSKAEMILEVISFFSKGASVNLGIGLPTLVAEMAPIELDLWIQSENGVMGVSGRPKRENASHTLINAGKETIKVRKGASYFDSALSFGMIRGGHIDFCVLGGMEVDSNGNLANWMVPGQKVTGMGGAMDLVQGAKEVIIVMTHFNKMREPKLVKNCTLPLTGMGVVNKVVTELGVFIVENSKFVLQKLARNVKIEDLKMSSEIL